jgi:hypothetical protein
VPAETRFRVRASFGRRHGFVTACQAAVAVASCDVAEIMIASTEGVTRSARISWPHLAPSGDLSAASQVAAGAANQRAYDPLDRCCLQLFNAAPSALAQSGQVFTTPS